MSFERVTIIGPGLIGASLGLALKEAGRAAKAKPYSACSPGRRRSGTAFTGAAARRNGWML